MKLTAIGIGNYRSIGKEPVWIDLTKKVNVIIGANNAGKSNVLKALSAIMRMESGTPRMELLDWHKRDEKNQPRLSFRFKFEEETGGYLAAFQKNQEYEFQASLNNDGTASVHGDPFAHLDDNQLRRLQLDVKGHPSSRADFHHWFIGRLVQLIPPVWVVPQFREIRKGDKYEIAGTAIVETLARWKEPEIGKDKLQSKFLKVQALLSRLIHADDIELSVDYKANDIIIRRDGLRLPLNSYGTGIHELIILAVAVYSASDVLFCIEEPEIHLHPRLQKELLDFLLTEDETNNVFVLTTHSNALINLSDRVNLIHVRQEDGITKSQTVNNVSGALPILSDLGYTPSDLLQANFIIWVEGPSDGIYINRWIKLIDPNLRERIDYQVMFYGGRCRAHLCADHDPDPTIEHLVHLLPINRHAAFVMDRDRDNADDEIDETKKRLRDECKRNDIYCWVTDGREIENYLTTEQIAAHYNTVTGSAAKFVFKDFDKIEKVLRKAYPIHVWKAKSLYGHAKPDMAREIVRGITADTMKPALRKHIEEIVKRINDASLRS